MRSFIVDTNIIFSALVKEGITRTLLLLSPFNLFMPGKAISEIIKYKPLILEKSGLGDKEFQILFSLILERIKLVKFERYCGHMHEAEMLMGQIDKDDSPFIALAFSFKNEGIWSEDKHFEKQNKIKIFKTTDIAKLLVDEF